MRLWHKNLIPVLPKQQLLGQWRECCLIAKNIVEKGTPNHLLVNKIMDYPIEHFIAYSYRIYKEFRKRHYNIDWTKLTKYIVSFDLRMYDITDQSLFADWHNDRYLRQCYYNLQEKYDCGGITPDEFFIITDLYNKLKGDS